MLRDATLDLLKFSPFPVVGEAVRNCIENVMQTWQRVVREKLPAADALTVEQLRDELPIMLHELADTLESMDGEHLRGLEKASEGHGRLRFHQSFNIDEVMIEYGILRSILIDAVTCHVGKGLSPEQSAALNMGIDTATRKCVSKFAAYQAQQLKAVAEAQSKYLSFLSHDLRGGLNGVLLMVEVLKRDLANQPQLSESMQDLDSMRKSILDTVATMDRFLHAERFRQGKVQPHNTTVEVSGLLRDLTSTFSLQAKAKGIDLQTTADSPITVHSDRELLLLILQNLVSNAVKYTKRGKVQIKAAAIPGDGVQIAVIDEGPGIAPERLHTLFDPFVRGDTHGQEGVGLGLSIAKQAADLIDAKLHTESKPGAGSTFMLELEKT